MSALTCSACGGEFNAEYYRGGKGSCTIHRATCTRRGAKALPWHYACHTLDNDHELVLGEIDVVPWLRACAYCMDAS